MRRMRERVLALLLALIMVVGVVPVPAFAADKTIYVLAGGDFQQAGDHTGSAENVTNILKQISQKYETMDGMLFVGDYDCETHESDDNGQTAAGITALMGAVQKSYSNINDANSILVQGNHDIKEARIDATGGHDFDGYSVFVLNEDDYPDGGGTQTGVQALADELESWLHNKLGEGYDAPIFITSHLPLAFSPRTNVVGDGKYAKLLFDVINSHAEEGLNIIFMHGHNHAYGNDNYLGGEAIYLPKGSNINIAELGSTTKWTEETLNFTYMNPGYVGYYNEWDYVTTEGTDKLTMTVFAITGSEVTVERYSANGLYSLKSEGRNGRYVRSGREASAVSLGLDKYYTAAVASPQTITLAEVEDYGDIGNWVGIEAETPADDVKPSNKGWVELIAPVPGTTTGGSTSYQYTQDTDGVNPNTGYLIVNSANAAAMDNNGTSSITTVELTAGESGKMVAGSREYEWIIDSNNRIYTTIEGKDYYLTASTNGVSLNGSSNATYSAPAWTVDNDKGQYTITYRINTGSYWRPSYTTYYLTSTGVSTTPGTVRLYSYEKDIVTGGTTTEDTNGTYGKIAGDLTYNATADMTADQAMAGLMGQIDGYYVEAMSTPGSDVAGTKVDDSVLTWEWVDTFDGNTAGDYEVAIKYGDFLLGTAEVVVPATTTYYAAEGNGLYLVDMNTSADNAMAAVKAGVTVSSATDANGTNKTAISDNAVSWEWVDKYNGADSGPYTVEILKDGHSLGTVEVKVDIQYETGIETDWTYIGKTEGSGGTKTVTYTLDTDGIDYGEAHKYIIVDDNQAIVLNANSSSNGTAHSITISGNTATTTTRDYEYHVLDGFTHNGTAYHKITKGDGTQYLYQESNGVRYGTRSSVKFKVEHMGNGLYRIRDIDGDQWCVVYNGSSWTVLNNNNHPERVRFYKFTKEETTGGTPGGSVYALIEGDTVYTVTQGSSATKALAAVKAGITGYTATDANGTKKTEIADSDSDLKWTWKNTFNGNSTGSYWVEISYKGKVLGTVEVKVEPGVVNNYPEYPNEGSVKVNKTGTGIDFQSSGIAQVEISASGVPMKKGADVIVMLDTSSSMESWCISCNAKFDTQTCNHDNYKDTYSRAAVLEKSFKNLIAQFKTPGDDDQLLDLRVAIADFNGFYGENHNASNTPYDRDAADMMSDDISYNANSEAQVYTGTKDLSAGAFIPVEDLATSYTLNYTSGTNYDYAFDAIYQLGTAIKEANGSEERDLYVIFMSDGAAMQWNYYHSQGASSLWNNWITGAWAANQLSLNCNTHAYYYDEVDHNGDGMRNEHRMANAIKGDPSEQYEVIRKVNTLGTPAGETNMYMVPGLGATMFSIAFDPVADDKVTADSMIKSIKSLASDEKYYYEVSDANQLTDAFTAIGSEIAYAAYNARFVDQMGDDYDLRMAVSNYSVVDGTTTTAKTITPKIEIITYDIYTRQDYLNGTITEDKIGDRKGTYKVLETVTFNTTGTEAYSDKKSGNILIDGVICAQSFWYNTNPTAVAVEGVSIPTGTKADGTTTGSSNQLPSETFYWKLGTVQTSELAMRYYVYLEGSMEGTREGGSYPTNEYATLYYDNYLHNPCKKDTVSPVMAWKEANVSYAFYLVNESGEIIVNQSTGLTGSFANKIAVTNPVVYETVLLNSDEEVSSIDIASLGVLPEGYTLYDYDGTNGATYTVTINSNTTGSWEITSVKDVATTYVTQYDPKDASAYSNALTNNTVGDDYTHTIVWFAVLWKVQALPDSVVIDYGLPVDISVLTNDMFGENGKLAGVGAYSDSLNLDGHDTALASGFGTSYTGTYGTAKADTTTGKVRYTLNTMQMNGYDKFAYAVNYTGNENAGYYYDTVTVIPATTIYYEEDFLTYSGSGTSWTDEGTAVEGATQAEDRPGQFSLTDANNIYGYDAVNKGMTTFSLGTAKKVKVVGDSFATATFTFAGTGFDVISMTSNTTGVIAVEVTDASGTAVANRIVNTYYGYTILDGKWVATPDTANSLYQVPVLQVEGLSYGTYTAKITATYMAPLDKTTGISYDEKGNIIDNDGYDLYLDAIRIYDPANDGAADGATDTTIEDAYKADGEGWPSYIELRNKIIAASSFDNVANDALTDDMEGLVFIDGDSSVGDAQISDYVSYGPNNEVYLASGQKVAFLLSNVTTNVAKIQIGIKSADGNPVTYSIKNIARNSNNETGVNAGDVYGEKTYTVDTATDMYYDLTAWDGDIIVIENSGESGILSLTNIKATYKENPNGSAVASEDAGIMVLSLDEEEPAAEAAGEVGIYMTPAAATLTLRSLNAPAVEEPETPVEPETPDEPETPVEPETPDEPETPEEPETPVEPEQPEEPEVPQQPSYEEIVETVVKKVVKTIKSLLGWLFK